MSEHAPVGGKFVTPLTVVLALLSLVAGVLLVVRFVYGLGAVTNLNDGYTFGIWVVVDIVIGTAFGCGGFAIALLIYIFNRGQYHPLVRPAVLASLFGYGLGGTAVIIDLGRWWNFWHIFWPGYAHLDSVMFEVAACVATYILVLAVEFSPAVLERFGLRGLHKILDKMLFVFIALGVLLPAMHQSSLGTLMVIAGHQIHPLWQTTALPVLFLVSAITMGFSVVVFEATMAAEGFRRPRETLILGQVSVVTAWLLAAFLVVRFADLVLRGELGAVFAGGYLSLMFVIETALFALPVAILAAPASRASPRLLFVAAVSAMVAGALYRIDTYLVAYNPGDQFSYFPSVPEMLVTVGLISFEILAYLFLVRFLPVLHRVEPEGAPAPVSSP